MSNQLPAYTAVIRTLGTAGAKYQQLLDSLKSQTHQPDKIVVYLAEGFPAPKETIGSEQIVRVKKGMVAQRALPYTEVSTEWMLMLDDDMAIEPDGVERLFKATLPAGADVCAIDGFPHHLLPAGQRTAMMILLSSIPRIGKKSKGYTITPFGSDVYNPQPTSDVAWSTSNSGNAFICKKSDFLNVHFEEDVWLDEAPYAIPEDKVMFYKMHLAGLKILTHYNSGFTHLDAGSAITSDREAKTEYSAARNCRIFYRLYVWPNLSPWQRPVALLGSAYQRVAGAIYHAIKRAKGRDFHSERRRGRLDADRFLSRQQLVSSK